MFTSNKLTVAEGGAAAGAAMLMSVIKNAMPSVYAQLDDEREYDIDELYKLIVADIGAGNGYTAGGTVVVVTVPALAGDAPSAA